MKASLLAVVRVAIVLLHGAEDDGGVSFMWGWEKGRSRTARCALR